MDYIGKSTYSTSIVTYKRREIMREYNILKNENYKNSNIYKKSKNMILPFRSFQYIYDSFKFVYI